MTALQHTRLFRLIHAALVALALFAAGSRANAAVPMCSEDGRTVAAPPIMRPSPTRVLESQGDCERLRQLLSRSNSGDHRGGVLDLGEAPLRAVPVVAVLPAAPHISRIGIDQGFEPARPARADEFDRPPRS